MHVFINAMILTDCVNHKDIDDIAKLNIFRDLDSETEQNSVRYF